MGGDCFLKNKRAFKNYYYLETQVLAALTWDRKVLCSANDSQMLPSQLCLTGECSGTFETTGWVVAVNRPASGRAIMQTKE